MAAEGHAMLIAPGEGEVKRDDGTQVGVHLDGDYDVVGEEADDDGSNDDDGPNDD